jgi:hypothetical protein
MAGLKLILGPPAATLFEILSDSSVPPVEYYEMNTVLNVDNLRV